MKLFIGRIMQYGYTGPISTSWRSQNASDAETLAQAMATQVLIWETVVGERDEDFNHISPGSYDAVKSVVSTAHPLYSQFISYYNSIEASVQRHSAIPSFMAKTPGKAQNVELAWNGTNYTATLTDSNNVLSNYSFSANEDGISFSVSGNKLVITAATAPSDSVRITASKSGATRRGIITWTDGRYAPGSGIQDVISYAQEVNDPVQAFLNLKVLQPADELRPERVSERHGAQSERAGTDADGADGSVGGRDGESESDGYDELGSEDEQYPEPGSGDRDGGGNLRLDYYDRRNEDKSLPFFGGDDTIREILGTTPHLKASKDEIY